MRLILLCSCFALLTGCSTVEGWLGMDEDDPAPAAVSEPDTTDTADTTATDTASEDTASAGDSAMPSPDVAPPDPVNDDCELLPTLASLEDQYFGPSCTFSSCHDSDNPAAALDLTPGNSYDSIMGVAAQGDSALMLIESGDPDASYLVHRVEGTTGVFMPPGITEPLDPDCRIATLRAWILAGAPAE
jgi:hypothetical protein